MRDRQHAKLGLAALLAAFVYHLPAFARDFDLDGLETTGFGDWQQIHHNWEAALVAIQREGVWGLWDPFQCGGVTLLGNPEAQHFSPLFLLSFAIGTTLALKLALVLHAWAGLVGAYLFARREHRLTQAGAVIAAVGFAMNGFFAWQMAGGHFTFVSFYLAPWLLLAWRRAARELRFVVPVALLLALTVAEGGTYPFPYFVLLLAFDTVVTARGNARRLGAGRAALRVAGAGIATGALAFLLGAIRFLPIVRTLRLFPREMQSVDAMFLPELIDTWTVYDFPWRHPHHIYVWNEYTAFVGWPLLALGLVGLVVALARQRFALIFGLLLFVGLMLGNRGPWAPWVLLHELPIYDSLRVPSRFSVFATFYLALLAGLGFDAIGKQVRALPGIRGSIGRSGRSFFAALLAFVAIAPAVAFGIAIHTHWDGPPIFGEPSPHFHYGRVNYQFDVASLPRRNIGTPQCYSGAMSWRPSPRLWLGEVPQARVEGGGGRVLEVERTTTSFTATAEMDRPGRLVFDSNHHPDWVADGGWPVVDDGGRLAVELPAGRHTVHVRYEPESLTTAIALSSIGLALALLGWALGRRRSRGGRRGG